MRRLAGINKDNRKRLAQLTRETRGILTVKDAAAILGLSPQKASAILSRYVNNGWLSRIRRGAYVIVPLEAQSSDALVEDAWVAANKLFAPCYIGGWSALEHWGLTEQLFNTTLVITSKKFRELSPEVKGAKFLLRVVYPDHFFGLKAVWRNNVKVQVSDPSRTIVDILSNPDMGGGIRPVSDAVTNYFKSEMRDTSLLSQYAQKLANQTVFKRLGFLLEYLGIDAPELLNQCKRNLSSGNSKLDPSLKNDRLVTRWRLFVPENWKRDI